MYRALAERLAGARPAGRPGDLAARQRGVLHRRQRPGDFARAVPGERSAAWDFLDALIACEVPIVASVNGAAVGVGTTLLLHCDLVYCSAAARFQLPFVNLGLCPEAASTLLLPARAGLLRAAEMLLLGEPFDAAAAREAGIVNAVLPPRRKPTRMPAPAPPRWPPNRPRRCAPPAPCSAATARR